MATSISTPSTNSILLNQWTGVYSSAPVSGFTGDVRVVVEAGNGNVRVTNTSGITAATGYGSLTNGTATSIAFEGSLANVNAALQSLQALGTNANANVSLNISAVKAGSAYYTINQHYYQFISSPGITWDNAKTAAEGLYFNGLRGYLATITSAEENAFIVPKLAGEGWIGASDAENEGTYKWVTGPEAGQTIGTGTYKGGGSFSAANGMYNNFASGEPNDYNNGNPGEDYIHFLANGQWNDYPGSIANIKGYIVEYGGWGGTATEALAQTTKTLTVNAYPVITSNGGGDAASISYAENGTAAVTTVTASDQDSGDSKTYSIYGTDAGLFNINASNGQLTFKTSPNYEDPKDSGGDNAYSVVVQVTDNTGLFRGQVLQVTVTDVNDLPVVTGGLPASIAATEDVSANVDLSALAFTDQEASQTFTLKLAATKGTLTATGTGGVTVAGSGSGGLTLTGTPAAVTAYLDSTSAIQYTGALNDNGTAAASIAVSYKDSVMGGFTAYGSTAVNITAVNDAPVIISATTAVALAGINEDQGNGAATGLNPGATVSSLFGARFSDVDAGASLSGIVVVTNTLDVAKGQWQYSTTANEWHDIGTVSVADGLVLSATSQLRFAPADNWFGTPSPLDVKLLDNTQTTFTSGAAKVAAPTTVTTASTDFVKLGTTVASVNDLPTISSDVTAAGLTETAGPDTSVTTATGALTGTLTVFDVEGIQSFGIRGGSGTTTITKAGFFGTLSLDTGTKIWTYTPSNFTAINALGEGKTATDTFDFSVADTNGATANQALTITYTGTNDLPVVVAAIDDQVFNGSGAWSYQIPASTFADAEGTALTYTVQVVANADGTGAVEDTITGVTTTGDATKPSSWLKFDAASRTLSGTPTTTAPLPLNIKVTASDGNGGTVADTFTVTLTAPTSDTNLTPSNLAPTTTDDHLVTTGSAAVTLTVNDFGNYSDANGDALALVLIVSSPSGVNGSLTYSTNGTTWNPVTGALLITKENIDLGYLKFTPGTQPAAITFKVNDGTTYSDAQTLTVDVCTQTTAVNMDASTVTTAKASEWTSVYSGNTSVLDGYSGTVRVVVEATGGTVKLASDAGVTAITQGYGSLTAGATSIAFEGTLGQVNAALQQLQANLATNPNMTLNVSAIAGGGAYNPQNGHYYEVVTSADAVTWEAAKDAAALKTFNGLTGYLATITSADENNFIRDKVPSDAWIGGSDRTLEGTWKWVTGPETGTHFSTGATAVAGNYANWNPGQPDDWNGIDVTDREDYAQFYATGSEGSAGTWNDKSGLAGDGIKSYIVEYSDGFGGTVAEQASRTITLNKAPGSSAPVLAIAGNANYTENAAPQALNPALALSDLDSTTLASATVTIGAGKVAGEDALAFTNNNATNFGNIAGAYVDSTGVLTLQSSGSSATLAQWTAALKAVTFASTSDNPGASRTISWKVNDGTSDSNVGTTTIAVTEVNDAPVAVNVADQTVLPGAAVSLNIGNGFTDPEGQTVTYSAEYQKADGSWAPVPATAGTFWLTFDATGHTFSGNPPAGLPFLNLRVNGTDTSTPTAGVGSTTFKLNLANADSGAAAANTVGTVSITDTNAGTVALNDVLTASAPVDADGITGAVGYQWQMSSDSGGTWADIGGATASTFTITQAQSNKSVRVQALYNDDGGFAEAPVSNALAVPKFNQAGKVTVNGITTPDDVLVASLSDSDGIVGITPTYQWYRGDSSGALTTPISGATDSSYKLVLADGGKFVSVKVSYTDQGGNVEAPVGSTSSPITLGAYPPVAVDDTGAATEAGGLANGAGGATGGSNAAGNVLTNDTDLNTAEVLTVAGVRAGGSEGLGEAGVLAGGSYTIAGVYGTLSINASTGAYTYTVNQTTANVQALIGGQQVTDVFNYTVKDPTNKTDTGLLTITLTGADDTLEAKNLPASFAVNEDQKMALVIPSNLSLVDPDFWAMPPSPWWPAPARSAAPLTKA